MRRLLFSIFLFASTAPAQTPVSGGGGALQSAIDAAAVGDTLVVAAGTYSPIEVSRGLSIVCDPGVQLTGVGPSVVNVTNLPAGETFALRGARMTAAQLTSTCFLSNCAGTVLLESNIGVSATGISILSCDQVALHDVRESHISIQQSTVTLVDCITRVTGSSSRVSISNLAIPSGIIGFFDVYLSNCESFVTSDGTNPLGIVVSGGTSRVDPRVPLGGGTISTQAGGIVLTQDIPTVSASPFTPGTMATASTSFAPGQLGALVLGLPSPVVPTPIGDYWGGATLLTLASGTPASGTLSTTIAVPALLAAGGQWVLHGVAIDLGGSLRIGPALATVVP